VTPAGRGNIPFFAQGTTGHGPDVAACPRVLLQPDIAAGPAPGDPASGKVEPALPADVEDDLPIARTDLEREEAVVAFAVPAAESADIATH